MAEQQRKRSRAAGDGTISERTNGSGKTVYRAQTPRSIGRRSETFAARKEARQWLAEQSVAATQGRLSVGRAQRLDSYLTGWLDTVQPGIRPRTLDAYRRNVRTIRGHMGVVKLEALSPAHVQDMVNALTRKGLAPRSVRQVVLTLHKALVDALRLELVYRNVADSVQLPRIGHKDEQWYSAEQLHALFDATQGDRFGALWVVLGTCGLRLGEALALQWTDIDFGRATLTVRRTVQRVGAGSGLQFSEPKSQASRRTIRLSGNALAALHAQRERRRFERKRAAELWREHGLVFASELGTPLEFGRVRSHWTAACEKAGIPRYRLHDLRHTVATQLTMAGMRPQDVARVLGHSSPALVVSLYGHAAPDAQEQAADVMDAVLAR